MKQSVSLFAMVMLITAAVDGVRNLPSIALFGPQLVFFFILGTILFLLPSGLVSAELTVADEANSGVYHWSKRAFGKPAGLITVWLQWVNTMIYFPTALLTIAGTLAYLINPALANDKLYLVVVGLIVFWSETLLSLKGIKRSALFSAWGTTLGVVIPMSVIIVLTVLWLWLGKPVAVAVNAHTIFPNILEPGTWTSLTAVMTAFLGMELVAVHSSQIEGAKRLFPRALIYAAVVIIITMGLGSLGVALVVPQSELNLVAGTVQAFDRFFVAFHMPWGEPVLAVMLILGSLGALIAWMISPSKGLMQAAQDGVLPKWLGGENKHGVAHRVLLIQGILGSIFMMAFFLIPSVNGGYWLLIDLSTQLYLFMYVFMFAAALRIFIKGLPAQQIPGGRCGQILTACLGLIGCFVAIVIGFIPPSGVDMGGVIRFEVSFIGGLVVVILPVVIGMWWVKKARGSKK